MEYLKVCKQCGKEFIAKRQHAECCSGNCRARYSQGLAPKANESESESESAQPPKQAVNQIEELYNRPIASNEILLEILNELKMLNARLSTPTMTVNIPLGGGYVPNVPLPDFDPPKVIFDEAAAKARSIANTLASISDF